MSLPVVQCASCKHFDGGDLERNVCTAFPGGIPREIINGDFDHRQPHPEDNGIQYEAKRRKRK